MDTLSTLLQHLQRYLLLLLLKPLLYGHVTLHSGLVLYGCQHGLQAGDGSGLLLLYGHLRYGYLSLRGCRVTSTCRRDLLLPGAMLKAHHLRAYVSTLQQSGHHWKIHVPEL